MVSVEYSEALVEVLEVLKNTDAGLVNKIPKKLIKFMKDNASRSYQVSLNDKQSLNELPLKEKTKDILAMLYRNYWCALEERNNYDKVLNENEEKYQAELREKYNPDNLFKSKNVEEKIVEKQENTQIIEYKQKNIFQKLIHRIKNFFHKNKY